MLCQEGTDVTTTLNCLQFNRRRDKYPIKSTLAEPKQVVKYPLYILYFTTTF